LGISFPEIYEMQSRAIFEAALQTKQARGGVIPTEIMVPLIGTVRELAWLRRRIVAVAEAVMAEMGERLDYKIGTMIELPRACLRAADIADESEFFSFGTNDLTQTVFGISRDDAPRFLHAYRQQIIFEDDPFATLDQRGVGELISMAVERGRSRQPGLTLGVCGEHGADPDSVRFFERLGLDYISCSPFRVPVAVLAAAQARLLEDGRVGNGGLFGGGDRSQQQQDEGLTRF
jgi:pyruvate,orthophosphate dikinase